MQKKKRGFTLVELLVVIAILAILAGVSVVGYLSFTQKAKESNDQTLLTQLNTVLQADEITDGKPKTMREAVEVLEENGFKIENLTPTSDKNEFLYNLKNNNFEIFSKDNLSNLDDGDYWYVVKNLDTLDSIKSKCSMFLIDSLTLTGELEIKYGFDSLNSNIQTLTLKNNNDKVDNIILSTNAVNIEITAAKDNVSHYGKAELIKINEVANESYHEYGEVIKIEMAKGHLEFMTNSKVNEIYVTDALAKVTITDKVKEYQNIIIIIVDGITLPEGAIKKPKGSKDIINEILVSDESAFEDSVLNYVVDETYGLYSYKSVYYKLINDVTITNNIEVKNSFKKRNVVIDLNGKTLYLESNSSNLIRVRDKNVVIKNGNINAEKVNYHPFDLTDEARLQLDDVNINFSLADEILVEKVFVYLGIRSTLIFNNVNYVGSLITKIDNFSPKSANFIINSGTYECNIGNYSLIQNICNLTINGGTFKADCTSSGTGVIRNEGNLIINGGEFISPKGATLYNMGNATLNGGRFISKSCSKCPLYESGITEQTHYVYSVYSGGTDNTFITINDGVYIEGVHGGLAVTSGGALINGGTIKTVKCASHDNTSHYALYLAGERGETFITINDGEFTSYDKVAMYVGNSNDGGNKENSRVIVKGGTFNGGGNKDAIRVDYQNGYLTILGGKYSSNIKSVLPDLNPKLENGYWVINS